MNHNGLYFAIGLGLVLAFPAHATPANAPSVVFSICAGPHRLTCIVDGDTVWLNGQKIRLEGIDAPEVEEYQCAAEKALGDKATLRLQALLNAGGWTVAQDGDRNRDKYGRLLRSFNTADGDTVGLELYREGLAHLYDGRGKRPGWCK